MLKPQRQQRGFFATFSLPTGVYFYLVSGRWFKASSLSGEWTAASNSEIEVFSTIPKDHAKSRVRVAVPGTPEAEEAVMIASIPEQAEVS